MGQVPPGPVSPRPPLPLRSPQPQPSPVGNLELKNLSDLSSDRGGGKVSRGTDDLRGTSAVSQHVLAIPGLSALSEVQHSDEVGARRWRRRKPLAEVGHGQTSGWRLIQPEVTERHAGGRSEPRSCLSVGWLAPAIHLSTANLLRSFSGSRLDTSTAQLRTVGEAGTRTGMSSAPSLARMEVSHCARSGAGKSCAGPGRSCPLSRIPVQWVPTSGADEARGDPSGVAAVAAAGICS